MRWWIITAALLGTACANNKEIILPDENSGSTYVPIDPIPVSRPAQQCGKGERLTDPIESLPDNAVRTMIEQTDLSGVVTFGVGKVKGEGSSFRVTVDFINTTTVLVPFRIRKQAQPYPGNENAPLEEVDPWEVVSGRYRNQSEHYSVYQMGSTAFGKLPKEDQEKYHSINIPVYVGLGIRVRSFGTTLTANVDISGLTAIGIQANAKALTGSLVAQTLGVSGKAVTTALPLHSDLNLTTAADALSAAASIKAQLYSADTFVEPRVVGFYLPIPASVSLINAVVSALSEDIPNTHITWKRTCIPVAPEKEVSKPILLDSNSGSQSGGDGTKPNSSNPGSQPGGAGAKG